MLLAKNLAAVEWRQFARVSGPPKAELNRTRRASAGLGLQLRVWAAVFLVVALLGTLGRRDIGAMVRDGGRVPARWFAAVERPTRHALNVMKRSK